LINSCNDYQACYLANAYLAFTELIGCCNDEFQCNDRDGLEIIEQGCVSSEPSTSSVPSSSNAPSEVPSFLPSSMPSSSSAPSEIPSSSAVPSESSQPSLAPSYIPSLQVFKDRCLASILDNTDTYGNIPSARGYVDCVDGKVRGTSQKCASACDINGNTYCCDDGEYACYGFTGKGKQQKIHLHLFSH